MTIDAVDISKYNRDPPSDEDETAETDEKPRRGKQFDTYLNHVEPYKHVIYILLLAILSTVLFSRTAAVPIADDLAQTYTKLTAREQLQPKIAADNPYLPKEQQQDVVEEEVKKFMETKKAQQRITDQAEQITQYYKTPAGVTYPYRYDTYKYVREAHELLNGEGTHGGAAWHIAAVAYLFNPSDPSAPQGAFWTPVIAGALAALLLYLLTTLVFNAHTAAITSAAFTIHTGVVDVFKGGAADTPALNMFYTIAILTCVIATWRSDTYLGQTTNAVLGIAAFALFQWTWRGAFYIIPLVLAISAVYWLLRFYNDGKYWHAAGVLLAGLAVTGYAVTTRYATLVLTRLNLISPDTIFPNGWSTVAELQAMTVSQYVDVYGMFFLALAAIGAYILLHSNVTTPDTSVIVPVWAVLAILPFLSQRFYMYALPPLTIAFGHAVNIIAEKLSTIHFGLTDRLQQFTITVVIIAAFTATVLPGTLAALNAYPYVGDAVQEVATDISIDTPEDTLVMTWWDYGYIYEYFSNRDVVMKASPTQGFTTYWFAKAMLSNTSRAQAMLDLASCEPNTAVNVAEQSMTTTEAVAFLERTAGLPRREAQRAYQAKNLSGLADHTHCGQNYTVVVSSDMLDRVGVLNKYASWNFKHELTMDENVKFDTGTCVGNTCSPGLTYNESTGEASLNGKHPKRFIHATRNFTTTASKSYPDGMNMSVVVVGNTAYYLEPKLASSFLVRALFIDDFQQLKLLTHRDLRKRVVAYTNI